MTDEALRKLACALKQEPCGCGKPKKSCSCNTSCDRYVVSVDIQKIPGEIAEKQLIVTYNDGSIYTRKYEDVSGDLNTFIEQFVIEGGILQAKYNNNSKRQVLNLNNFTNKRDFLDLKNSIKDLIGLKIKESSITIDCECATKSPNRPYRRGNKIYFINECGDEEFLFDILDNIPPPPKPEDTYEVTITASPTSGESNIDTRYAWVVRKNGVIVNPTSVVTSDGVDLLDSPVVNYDYSRNETITLTIDRKTFTQNFRIEITEPAPPPVVEYNVNVVSNPTNAGSVTTSHSRVRSGERVTISATPNENWTFVRWELDGNTISTSGSHFPFINKDSVFTAVFTEVPRPNPEREVRFTSTSFGTISGTSVRGVDGTPFSIIATENEEGVFDGWYKDNALVTTSTELSGEISEDATYEARFREAYKVHITAQEGGTFDNGKTDHVYILKAPNNELILAPQALPGYEFVSAERGNGTTLPDLDSRPGHYRWSNTFAGEEHKRAIFKFRRIPEPPTPRPTPRTATVIVNVGDGGMFSDGTTEGKTINYTEGNPVTLNVTPNERYSLSSVRDITRDRDLPTSTTITINDDNVVWNETITILASFRREIRGLGFSNVDSATGFIVDFDNRIITLDNKCTDGDAGSYTTVIPFSGDLDRIEQTDFVDQIRMTSSQSGNDSDVISGSIMIEFICSLLRKLGGVIGRIIGLDGSVWTIKVKDRPDAPTPQPVPVNRYRLRVNKGEGIEGFYFNGTYYRDNLEVILDENTEVTIEPAVIVHHKPAPTVRLTMTEAKDVTLTAEPEDAGPAPERVTITAIPHPEEGGEVHITDDLNWTPPTKPAPTPPPAPPRDQDAEDRGVAAGIEVRVTEVRRGHAGDYAYRYSLHEYMDANLLANPNWMNEVDVRYTQYGETTRLRERSGHLDYEPEGFYYRGHRIERVITEEVTH